MLTRVLLTILVALPLLVSSRRTHCERWKGDKEFRCAKDDYHADRIHIRNLCNDNVVFRIGKWYSVCGQPGINYSSKLKHLSPGRSVKVFFGKAKSGKCNEFFIHDCCRNGDPVNCLDVISVYPR